MPTHETTSVESDNAVAATKETQRNTWTSGDYAAVANLTDSTQPDHLLRLVSIEPGQRILDVATGSGNVALRAAKAGAEVIGLDLTPALLDKAQQRADDWGVQVDWQVGDAEALPYDNDTFDRVLSALGVIFAPRHTVAARELARVCKPGGVINLVNWTPAGQGGQLLQIMGTICPRRRASPPRQSPGVTSPTSASYSPPTGSTRTFIAASARSSSRPRRTTGRPSRRAHDCSPKANGRPAARRSST